MSETLTLAPAQRIRALVAILTTAFLAGVAMGSAMPMVAIAMEVRGESAVAIGWVSAAAPIAVLVTSPFIPGIVDRIGLLPAIIGGAVITATAFCAMPTLFDPVIWFVLRFVTGVGIAIEWILGETWINAVATSRNRGRVVMLYTLLLTVGFLVGPLLSRYFGVDSWLPFYVASGVIALSVVPLVVARDCAPVLPESARRAFASSFRSAPLIMSVAFVAGFTDAAQVSFLPVYAVRMGLPPESGLVMLTVLIAGSCFLLVLIGWLADRMNRRRLLLICVAATSASGALLPLVFDSPYLVWPVLALWGGVTFSLYSVALVIIGDRFPGAALAGASAAFIATFEIGGVSGPVIVGYAVERMGPNGMPAVLAAICMPLLVLAWLRRGRSQAEPEEASP